MDWMNLPEKTLEEELYLETTLRQIESCDDIKILRGLCTALTSTGWHQAKLLKQAVNYIASVDQSLMDFER